MSFEVGDKVGAYDILEQLGKGGMATVFKAYHAPLDRYVAIKVLHPAFKDDAAFLRRFTREAQVVARLTHAHIVPVYDFAEQNGYPYLVMRYINGRTLKRRLATGPIPLPDLMRLSRSIADALHYAHQQGVLHRDIKPSNILLATEGDMFITDFGLARITHAGESTMSQDMLMGTPQYISPEQAKGLAQLDLRTDIYSFGIVLYEMVTGRVPFQSDTSYAVIHSQIFDDPPRPSSLNDKISPAMEEVLLKALQKNPEDRFATTLDLSAAFEEAAHDLPGEIAPAVDGNGRRANILPSTVENEEAPSSPVGIIPKLPELDELASGEPANAEPPPRPSKRRTLVPVAMGTLVGMCLLFIIIMNGRAQKQEAAVVTNATTAPVANPPSPDESQPSDTAGGEPLPVLPKEVRSVETLETLLETNPDSNQLRAELAMAYWRDGRSEEARTALRRILANSRLPFAYITTAERLLEVEQEELAILVLEEGLLRFEDNVRMQQTLMMALIISGSTERRIDTYLERLRAEPQGATRVTIRIGEAYLAYRNGALESPPQIMGDGKANENDPYLADIYFLEGAMYLNQEDGEQALNAFEQALQHQPSRWLELRLEKLIDELQ